MHFLLCIAENVLPTELYSLKHGFVVFGWYGVQDRYCLERIDPIEYVTDGHYVGAPGLYLGP